MLREIYEWLGASTIPAARQLGLVTAAVAINQRHRRCREAWSPHLRRTRAFIEEAAADCTRHRTALLLGAGACLDIPLAALSRRFERVVLVDVVLLRGTRALIKAFPNVDYQLHDVSETLALVQATGASDPLQTIRAVEASRFLDDATVDFVASVNLVSQLPLMPMRKLLQSGRYTPAAINQLGVWLMRQHVSYLSRFPARRALIYDAEMWRENRLGEREEVVELRGTLGLPVAAAQSWLWHVAPPGEDKKGAVLHQVEAAVW